MRSPLALCLLALAAACNRADDKVHASGSSSTTAKPTAMDQSNAKADLDHLGEIRKALVADDSLSVAAKNVQVLTKDGHVLLRGKVPSATERETVERHVRAAPATRTVDDQIEIGTK